MDFGVQFLRPLVFEGLEQRSSITALAIVFMFRRAVEVLDATDLLIAAGSVVGAQIVSRSLLECVVGALYLARASDERVAAACLLGAKLGNVELHEELLKRHVPGAGPAIDAKRGIDRIMSSIAEQRLQREANQELQRLRMERGDGVRWFEVFGGPRTLQSLVHRLQDETLEDLFDYAYGPLSRAAHADDVVYGAGDLSRPGRLLRPVRGPAHEQSVPAAAIVRVAHALFARLVLGMQDYFGPDVPRGPEWWWELQKAPDGTASSDL